MNRNRFLVAALAMGGLLGAAEVRSTTADQQKRLEEFQAKAMAARRSQNLEGKRNALVTKYPTPEISLSRMVDTVPGNELVLKVPGSFVPDSLVTLPCEGFEVLSSKVTARQVEARVRVGPNAMPGECELHVYSPVSLTHSQVPAVRVGGDYVWELKLANGMTSRWKTSVGTGGAVLAGQSEWFQGGKPLGTRKVELESASYGLQATVQRTEAEDNAAYEIQNKPSESDNTAEQLSALLDKITEECSKLPDNKQAACSQKYQGQMDALQKKLYDQRDTTAKKAAGVSAVCSELKLKVRDGKVTGTGSNCGGANDVAVTGTFKPAAKK